MTVHLPVCFLAGLCKDYYWIKKKKHFVFAPCACVRACVRACVCHAVFSETTTVTHFW